MHFNTFVLLLSILFGGCTTTNEEPISTWQEFCCRDDGNPSNRTPLYRAKVPINWQIKLPDVQSSIQDTIKPNVKFYTPLHVTLHTFPTDFFDQRIPTEAQISRWKQQFDELDTVSVVIEPLSRSGFTGHSLYAEGILKGCRHAIYGFSMLMAPVHWSTLQPNENASFKSKQMASGYTIKASGDPQELQKRKQEIEVFANSFELIEEIPSR